MKRKFLIFLCLILFFVSVAAVSAAEDVNQTITVDTNNVVSSVDILSISAAEDVNRAIDDDALSVSEDVNVISAKDDGTFTALQKKINDADEGAIINLENNYIYDSGFSTGGITINKALTINGNGHVIDALGQSRIFYIDSSSIIINNVIFKNGNAYYDDYHYFFGGAAYNYYGGAIYNQGNLSLSVCSFVNNSAKDGGAIDNNRGNLSLSVCSFVNNSANYGGAIINWDVLSLSVCSFVNNSANYGGAIDNEGDFSLSGCSFVNNSAKDGGAIYSNFITRDNIISSTFKNNSPNNINKIKTSIVLKKNNDNNVFVVNGVVNFVVNDVVNVDIYSNGKILNENGKITVKINGKTTKINVNNGTATFKLSDLKMGGYDLYLKFEGNDLYNASSTTEKIRILDASYLSFTDLQDLIYETEAGSTIKLKNNFIYGLNNHDDTITIRKSITIDGNGYTIDGNNVVSIFSISEDVTLKNICFVNGYTYYGGAIYNQGNLILSGCSFVNNSAKYGGAIYIHYLASIFMDGCSFVNNSAKYGGAIYNSGSNLTVGGCSFVNNSAKYGGAIVNSGSNLTVGGCSFVNNSADDTGGAIYNCGELNVTGSTFRKNSADGAGGAIHNDRYGTLTVTDCIFESNSASEDGGAIHSFSIYSLIVSDCIFEFNSAADGAGGAIYYSNGSLTVEGCNFVNNSASEDGGAINGGYIVVINSEFLNNKAYKGGSIYCGSNSIENCNFTNNSAHLGSSIHLYGFDGTHDIYLNDCNFVNNDEGNSIYFSPDLGVDYSGKISLSNLDFNVLHDFGGAISLKDNILTITGVGKGHASDAMGNHWEYTAYRSGGVSFYDADEEFFYKSYFNSNGVANIYLDDLNLNIPSGTHNLEIYIGRDKDFASLSIFLPLTLIYSTNLEVPDVTKNYGGSEKLEITLTENGSPIANADVNININNRDYVRTTDSNGKSSMPIDLNAGSYDAIVSYGDVSTTAKIIVNKAATTISAPNVNVAYKDTSGELVATIINEHGKPLVVNLNVNFNGKTYNVRTDSNGKASIPVGTLSPGKYTAKISYKGSGNYKSSSTTAKVTVTKADTIISASNVSVAYKDSNGALVTTIVNEHGKPLVVTLNVELNGKTYTVKTDSNGQASIPIGTLSPGKYTAKISYKGSSNYKASSTTAKVTVTKAATIISASDVNVAYKGPNGELVATIINEHGKPLVVTLSVNLNGKTYTVKTDSNGQASIPIGTLTSGTYTAKISYKGSGNYKASSTTAKVTVTKADTIISAPNVNIAYKDSSGELVATIINEHGKPLVVTLNINLNGKTYTVKTDSNGQAKIPIDMLTPGTYTAKISYKGSGNYKASSTTAKITITKAATIISAPDVSVAYKSPNGKLVSTITNEHGKPLVVNLNVELNGKTYSVKTDSNGQISVSTADLAPGSYTATISYKGSGNYKASSTTANIKVKK